MKIYLEIIWKLKVNFTKNKSKILIELYDKVFNNIE